MDIHDVIWETDKKHVSQGGWGMSTTLETVAKLGRLLLNEGKWNGIQLLNREWDKYLFKRSGKYIFPWRLQ